MNMKHQKQLFTVLLMSAELNKKEFPIIVCL